MGCKAEEKNLRKFPARSKVLVLGCEVFSLGGEAQEKNFRKIPASFKVLVLGGEVFSFGGEAEALKLKKIPTRLQFLGVGGGAKPAKFPTGPARRADWTEFLRPSREFRRGSRADEPARAPG